MKDLVCPHQGIPFLHVKGVDNLYTTMSRLLYKFDFDNKAADLDFIDILSKDWKNGYTLG